MAERVAPAKGDDSVILAGVRGRGDVDRALPDDLERGLAIARAIREPWYRCQSLALVARVLDDRRRPGVLTEAFQAADEQSEPNRIVTVASWPLEVLAELGPRDRLRRETERLMAVIATEPHNLRRADGVAAVLHRVWVVPDVRAVALGPFLAACAAGHGWRRDRLLRRTAQRLAGIDVAAAIDMVAMIEEARVRRLAAREVAAVTAIKPPVSR